MRFTRIELENYRCFSKATISFAENNNKNINLIIGENGSGKTELLFSFQWALYGFDFNTLTGKTTNKYSLNSTRYNNMNPDDTTKREYAIVSLFFEVNGIEYQVKTTETFFYNSSKKINSEIVRELIFKNEKKESTNLKKRGVKHSEYDIYIQKLIPIKILNGLLFDGEKMKQLTAFDSTNKAVEGIIEEITSTNVIDNLIDVFKNIRRETNKENSKISKNVDNGEFSKKIDYCIGLEKEIEDLNERLNRDSEKIELLEFKKKEIESFLSEYKENTELINEKNKVEILIKQNKNSIQDLYKDLSYVVFNKGYLLMSDELFDSVKEIIEKTDIPKGLTSEAIDSILKKGTCICGNPLNLEEKKLLKILQDKLPPLNINSTILESLNNLEEEKQRTNAFIDKEVIKYYNLKDELNTLIEKKADYNSRIIKNVGAVVGEKEKQKDEINFDLGSLKTTYKNNFEVKKIKEQRLKKIKKEIENYENKSSLMKKLASTIDFCNNSITIIEKLKEYNKKEALNNINKKLDLAYRNLSEDYILGKRVYISQFDIKSPYQILVYFEKAYDEQLKKMKVNGEYEKYIKCGLSEEAFKEKVLLKIVDGNSQGQSEINTLAFVKAIMEYAIQEKDDGFEIERSFPLLIDSPFGQLSGINLNNVATRLTDFSKQIILFLSPSRYEEVKNVMTNNISSIVKLNKSVDQNATTVSEERF